MKSCLVFAASIFDQSRIEVITDFFSSFKTYFADCSFYVGINYGSLANLENIIESFGLDCRFARLHSPGLYTRTDASAYQIALNLLKGSNQEYDLYWFAHTKGGVNPGRDIRHWYLREYFAQRRDIEQMFAAYPHLGSYGLRGNSISAAGVEWWDYKKDTDLPICQNTKFASFVYDHVNWSYIETIYTIKKDPVEAFLANTHEAFYNTVLDPWYFETTFPWIGSRCGYFPYLKDKTCFWKRCNLNDITAKWIENNGLTHLAPYLNL
jgi:hypothetical protein